MRDLGRQLDGLKRAVKNRSGGGQTSHVRFTYDKFLKETCLICITKFTEGWGEVPHGTSCHADISWHGDS